MPKNRSTWVVTKIWRRKGTLFLSFMLWNKELLYWNHIKQQLPMWGVHLAFLNDFCILKLLICCIWYSHFSGKSVKKPYKTKTAWAKDHNEPNKQRPCKPIQNGKKTKHWGEFFLFRFFDTFGALKNDNTLNFWLLFFLRKK